MVEIVNLGSILNELNVFPGIVGLEVMNTLGTVKVLDSNLTGPVFFSNGINSVPKRIVDLLFVCLFCWLSCHILEFFLLFSIIVAFSV